MSRIDSYLNTIDSVIARLQELRPDVKDVHDLAYNRKRAADQAKVSGGSRDYALDTNGDMHARELYQRISDRQLGMLRFLEADLKELRRFLNRDDGRVLRRDGSADVTANEFDQVRYARDRRLERGEHHPNRLVSQPERKHFIDPVAELEHLRAAVRRIHARCEADHRNCRDDEGRRKQRWLDRSILTPAQRDALDRSLRIDPESQAS